MGHPRPVASRSQGKSPVPADGYLPLLGAPALRFVEDLPPVPPAPRLETTTQLKAPAVMTGPDIVGGKAATSNSARPITRTEARVEPIVAEKTAPLSILPDENRPQVKPEDFLPYFQIPNAAPLPKSTATYTETTK